MYIYIYEEIESVRDSFLCNLTIVNSNYMKHEESRFFYHLGSQDAICVI